MRAFLLASALACTPATGQQGTPAEPAPAAETEHTKIAGEAPSTNTAAAPAKPAPPPTENKPEAGDENTTAAPPPLPATAPQRGTLRLVVLHTPPDLLMSQERQLSAMEESLRGQGRQVTREPASADERAYAEAEDGAAPLPAAWSSFETVVVVRLAEPKVNRKGKRLAQGVRDLLLVRPPETAPVFSQRGSAEAGVRLDGKDQAKWIASILTAAQTGEDDR